MGFALPALSFLRLSAGIRLPALALGAAAAPPWPAGNADSTPDAPPSYAVLTLNKARSRNRRTKASRRAGPGASAQTPLPLEAASEQRAPAALRIIQRHPSEQPECLFISGRMADVCAALERMAACEACLNN